MREIKFRAWDKENKEMVDIDAKFFFQNGRCIGINDSKWSRGEGTFEAMQFTGLKDKNGKEIYEGDIIKTEDGCLGEVRWRKFGFEQSMINTLGWWVIQEIGEIIGNIYSNPELLKQ